MWTKAGKEARQWRRPRGSCQSRDQAPHDEVAAIEARRSLRVVALDAAREVSPEHQPAPAARGEVNGLRRRREADLRRVDVVHRDADDHHHPLAIASERGRRHALLDRHARASWTALRALVRLEVFGGVINRVDASGISSMDGCVTMV